MPKEKVPSLFDNIDDFNKWKEEWKDMPEFVQEDLTSWKSVIVHFENEDGYKEFQKLIQQKLTYKTQSIWFPKVENTKYIDKIYVNES